MGNFLRDIRYGARMLRRSPGFTLVAVVALAVGIGATTAIYTVVDAVLLRALPFPRSHELVDVETILHGELAHSSLPDFVDYGKRSRTLGLTAAWTGDSAVLTDGGEPVQLDAVGATVDFFRVLDVAPALGRGFDADDARAGGKVAVLGHELWQRRFHGDPGILGRSVQLDGQSYSVIGVAAPRFNYPLDAGTHDVQLYRLLPRLPEEQHFVTDRGSHFASVIARLKPGMTAAQAQADLQAVAASLRHDYPEDCDGLDVSVDYAREVLVKPVRAPLILLLLAVGCVLLIACANVAGLLLARATVRQREIAIRTALGAGRGRIVRQMLTESVLLGLVGGGVGVLVALWLVDLLAELAAPALPHLHALTLDGRVLGVTLLLSLATSVLFGLVPALHASRTDLNEALKETARATAHGHTRRLRNGLLIAEIAVALVLLVGAGLTLRSLSALLHVDLGFDPENLVVTQMRLPDTRYTDEQANVRYYRQLDQRLRALPGVDKVGIGGPQPFGHMRWGVGVATADGQPLPQLPTASIAAVSPDYFATLGIGLRQGRLFEPGDDSLTAPGRLVVSRGWARQAFGGAPVLGRHVRISIALDSSNQHDTDVEIIGVVDDVRTQSPDTAPQPLMYVAFGRLPIPVVGVALRGKAPLALLEPLRQALLAVDRELPPASVQLMTDRVGTTVRRQRVIVVLLSLFAAVALVLTTIGIYGVISYTVTQRTRELGIRIALGAAEGEILRLVLGESLALSLWAVGIGVAVALALGRVLRSMLYGVAAYDLVTLLPVCALVLLVCALASLVPARRATKVDPMVALRYE